MATTTKAPLAHTREIGKLTLDLDSDAVKRVIADGRLLELAAVMGAEASAQISAQIVDRVADIAAGGASSSVSASFVLEGGDFGTVPPRPHFGIGRIRFESQLQRVVAPTAEQVLIGG